uniref:Uncharacterized protein n=1 Tax=Anguilla anguilla TaxID=7936 RepID=A0A0E9PEP4_ANGAN
MEVCPEWKFKNGPLPSHQQLVLCVLPDSEVYVLLFLEYLRALKETRILSTVRFAPTDQGVLHVVPETPLRWSSKQRGPGSC